VTHLPTLRHYVGKTNYPSDRWAVHRRAGRRGRGAGFSKLHAAIHKHGAVQFRFQVIETFTTEDEALAAEEFWIATLRSNVRGYGFNLNAGGRGGRSPSDETRAKIGAASKAKPRRYWLGKTHSDETKAKIGDAFRGKPWSPARRAAGQPKGRSRPPDVRAKVSATLTGRVRGPMPDEWKRAISSANAGRPKSEATKQRMRDAWVRRKESAK
jgi:group I intron endonuclease